MAAPKPIHIVRLDAIHCPDPDLSSKFTLTSYPNTAPSEPLIIDRLTSPIPATIAITTRIPITASILEACPSLKLVAVLAIGTDMLDLVACKERGVTVVNVPAASNESVAEQAIALFFSLRRNVVRMHGLTVEGVKWVERGTLKAEWGECPATCKEERVGIIGGGELGNRVATHCRALGMTVSFAERKGVAASAVRPDRVEFTNCLHQSTVLFLTLPLSEESKNMISTPEFSLLSPHTLIINVARGGIIDEPALIAAIESKQIMGAATDVYLEEPAGLQNSVLVRAANKWNAEQSELNGRLILSPHIAWWATSSIEKLRRTTRENVVAWEKGEPVNVVVEGKKWVGE